MKPITNTIITTVIAFIVALTLNFLLETYLRDKGTIVLGPIVQIGKQIYFSTDISNFSTEPLNNLLLSMPKSTTVGSIVSSSPIQVEKVSSLVAPPNMNRVSLSGIEPNQITKVLVPIAHEEEASLVYPINAKQIKIKVLSAKEIFHPITSILKEVITLTTVYTIFFGIFTYLSMNRAEKLTKKLEKAEADLKREVDKTETRIIKLEDKTNRVKILLMSRLSDYSRELDFWRDTIRKLLYKSSGSTKSAEELIEEVTRSLKTHSTRSTSKEDFDTLKVLAGLLSDSKNMELENRKQGNEI